MIRATERKKTLFLVSTTTQPCGVESFARHVAARWGEFGLEARRLPVSGAAGDWAAIWRALGEVDALAINLPVVAWKKVVLTPLVALVFALLRGRGRILILHEWADLDWRRRLVIGAYALFAQRLVFSSPFVRDGFTKSGVTRLLATRSAIAPIPSNIPPTEPEGPSPVAERIRDARAEGRIVIGHFGSIYPKKQSDFVLDVAARLRDAGHPVLCLFIGGFVKGVDRVEEEFRAKAEALGLSGACLVTGYVDGSRALHALFAEVDCFLYRFPEGLTSRRGSVLACLQSGKPVIVNAPCDAGEFDHHRAYRRAIADGSLMLLPHDADARDYAEYLARAERRSTRPLSPLYDQCWRDAAAAVAACLDAEPMRAAPLPAE
ncbi:glycosyltransferase [Methylosinus sp. H3A]|uniref:glycosyltransferase n=1 Tax=Methylosinus sp. H3A TaxID=2785786 RepID=UPI0018C21858|nr:glycosyltransferase [Methylosinus sp. H3A]MBG0811311.1 glycosyltransferase [Methylosinus sp. H3A]